MSEEKKILEVIIGDFSMEKFGRFFRGKSNKFVLKNESFSHFNDQSFKDGILLGEINFSVTEKILVVGFSCQHPLSERLGKKAQYEKAKKILKLQQSDGGIFIFSDQRGDFRFSLVYPEAIGKRRLWSNFRRFTYFVSREFTNKTFLKQIGEKDFSKFNDIKAAFSVSAVTDLFYKEFFEIYDKVVASVRNKNNSISEESARDFVLLFSIRTVFLGFIQKKKWLGGDEKFIQNFFQEYKNGFIGKNEFYAGWLAPLFFEALNSPQGRKVAYGNNDFSKEMEEKLQMAPYLNGGLFRQKIGYDDNGWVIPDQEIGDFFDFLFAHSFTIEENSLDDEDLQLNPEFLGIIFERLVNKADGAVYTPRPEVDLMCRLSLVKWLEKNLENPVKADNLYELFFRESENEEDQKQGSFSKKEALEIAEKLANLSICDPAVGSGAFLVGMMQVLDEIETSLGGRFGIEMRNVFERKKEIIKKSLYGVEVKEWAVWICQLRLWLSLFVDAPDELKNSSEPILPSLDFKVRQGDSLVQRIGSKAFPVSGHNAALSKSIKDKITKLKNLKLEYFDNKSELKDWELRQRELGIYEEILSVEIKEKEDELKKLKNLKPTKLVSLFGEEEIKQQSLELDKEKIKSLEMEISELRAQKKALRSGGKPLVWSIEFAEVFAEKNGFDLIIGNPPYVRQEEIADPTGKIKDKKEYKNYLEEMVKLDFPDDFPKKAKINAQSDLYTYFYIRGLRLLNPQGIHTFICSNSWLDVGYGVWLQNFLLKRCPVELIVDNHAKRSFEAADVNTIISIIHAPQKKVAENRLVKFVAFKKSFDEAIYTENMLAIEKAEKVESNETFRVYPIAIKDLRETGTEYADNQQKTLGGKYVGDKWGGKYLRCSDVIFDLIQTNLKGKGVLLRDRADIESGLYSGINEFFYLTASKVKQLCLPSKYCIPLLKSPRHVDGIALKFESARMFAFVCHKSKDELRLNNEVETISYIEWGEKQITKEKGKVKAGILWSQVATVKNRKPSWYCMPMQKSTSQFMFYGYNDRFIQPFSADTKYLADRRLHFVYKHDDVNSNNLAIILNTTLVTLFIELQGRVSMGGGALDYATMDAKKTMIFDPNLLKDVLVVPRIFLRKSIDNIFVECGINPRSNVPIEEQEPRPLSDRAELDKIVFDALDLGDEERKEVYRAVCRLVWNRISKAKSV